jgi:hypothetical protein
LGSKVRAGITGETNLQLAARFVQSTGDDPNNSRQETTMNSETRTEVVTRDSVLKLLSDEEVARVSTAETAPRLSDGDEFLDLEHLELGVRRSLEAATPMAHVLPRKSVQEKTWNRILAHLATPDQWAAKPGVAEPCVRHGFFQTMKRAARAVFH